MMLAIPVSSSRLRNTTPRAVPGCWRWVTSPPTVTTAPLSAVVSARAGSAPRSSSTSLMCSIGWVP
jgi:hypothetical protein